MIIDTLLEKLNINQNIDLYIRECHEESFNYTLIFFSSLVDEFMIMELQRSIRFSKDKFDVINKLDNIKISTSTNFDNITTCLYEGQVILYISDIESIILVDVRKVPSRTTQEPEAEKSIRGSKDGFTESIINNISLLRTRIKSQKLIIEGIRVGDYSKTSICICYINDIVDMHILDSIKKRINELSIDSLIMSDRALEELLTRQNKTIFPLVRYTERPDVASIYLLKGHIVLLVDTSSSSIILPISLFDHMKNVEEYRQNNIIGNFIKIIRYFSIFLSVFFIPVSYLLSIDNSIINVFDTTIQNSSSIPLSFQFIIGLFVIEIFRIAIIHTPNTLSSALSIVIGIILGEVSMSLGLFVKDVLLVLSIGTICSFSTPSYELSLSNRIISFFLLIVSILFGKVGFLISIIVMFLHLVSIKIYGFPYLYPLIPFDFKKIKDKIFKTSSKRNKKL